MADDEVAALVPAGEEARGLKRQIVFVIVCVWGGRNAKVERVTCMYGRKETPQQVLTLARLLT